MAMGGSLFTGLQVALSGLEAQQTVMAVTSHNVANATTPGYERQQADLAANPPYTPPSLQQVQGAGQLGMGVTVASIQRSNSRFLHLQQWANAGDLGAAGQQAQTLSQVQSMLNEPSSTGLNSALSAFWNAWQDVANSPQSTAARSQAVAAGSALASQFHTLSSDLTSLQSSLNSSVGAQIGRVNTYASQIASLNGQIKASIAAGQKPNDLLDARAVAISKLSTLVPVHVTWNTDGTAAVSVGSVDVVAGTQVTPLVGKAQASNHGFLQPQWNPPGLPAQLHGGSLGALLTLRDQTLPGYLASLNALAGGVGASVNQLHASGYDLHGNPGQAYFVASGGGGITAANIAVNPALVSDPTLVAAAASATSGPGDGHNALAIADLQSQALPVLANGGTATASGAWAAMVGGIGSAAQAASSAQQNQQVLANSIQSQQQQVSGVSINEEMTNMVVAQNAYAAAAKVSSTIDSMLGSLIAMVP